MDINDYHKLNILRCHEMVNIMYHVIKDNLKKKKCIFIVTQHGMLWSKVDIDRHDEIIYIIFFLHPYPSS